MKTSAKHINWLNFGIFEGNVLFVCGFTFEEMLRHFKRTKTPDGWVATFESTKNLWDASSWGFVSKREMEGKTYFFLVLKKRFDFKDDSHAKLAHEIVHLASFHLIDLLDPMKENEAFAYTHTYLMRQCYKILRN